MNVADDFAGLEAIEFLKVGNDLREYVDAARAVSHDIGVTGYGMAMPYAYPQGYVVYAPSYGCGC
jgi:hypothetical protein